MPLPKLLPFSVLQVEDDFMPWLLDQAVQHLERGMLARQVVAQLVAGAVGRKADMEEAALAAAEAAEAAAAAAAEQVRLGAHEGM
jgi:hypothetical protein